MCAAYPLEQRHSFLNKRESLLQIHIQIKDAYHIIMVVLTIKSQAHFPALSLSLPAAHTHQSL